MADDSIAVGERVCSRCGETKLLAEFVGIKKGAIDCLQCADCRAYGSRLRLKDTTKTRANRQRAFVAWRVKHPKLPSREAIVSPDGRLCRTCERRLPDTSFGKDRRAPDGLAWRCRECARNAHRGWSKENADHVKDVARGSKRARYKEFPAKDRKILRASRLKKFGLTYEDFQKMLLAQDYKCAVCCNEILIESDRHSYRKSACVDHDHKTGRVRALLCNRCNSGIGLFGDDLALLQLAVDYLRKYGL